MRSLNIIDGFLWGSVYAMLASILNIWTVGKIDQAGGDCRIAMGPAGFNLALSLIAMLLGGYLSYYVWKRERAAELQKNATEAHIPSPSPFDDEP